MQTTQRISPAQLQELLRAVFAIGAPMVAQAYSDYGMPVKIFSTLESLEEDMAYPSSRKEMLFCYQIHYPEAKGAATERRINLKPGAVPGQTHRFVMEGWGLIQLQCGFKAFPSIECRVAVNSEIRAQKWSANFSEMGPPELWDWNAVKRYAGRLVRLLRKLGMCCPNRAALSPASGP